jgi:BirA family biotin operon repressor/biotin-[acetyl-CoA-carboxylase] ligase
MDCPALDRDPRAPGGADRADSFAEYEPTTVGDWAVRGYGTVSSTQDIAAGLPAWTAAVAQCQTAGRGQWDRSFTSDRGGLYLTAVLPFDGRASRWRGFALAVGWAVTRSFLSRGIARLRLRWPNDLMIGDRKVGGILVSQGGPDTVCVGLGMNVRNRPWLEDPGLRATACRLADFAPDERLGTDLLSATLLGAIRLAYVKFSQGGLRGLVAELNQSWGAARDVRLELVPGAACAGILGRFRGILPDGDLIIEDSAGTCVAVRSHLVKRLHEG